MAVEVLRVTEPGNAKKVGQGGIFVEYGAVTIRFGEPRGFGETLFAAEIAPSDFGKLALAMMRADSTEAVKAFGHALKGGIQSPLDPRKTWSPEWEAESLADVPR